jgi:hypothetical protein
MKTAGGWTARLRSLKERINGSTALSSVSIKRLRKSAEGIEALLRGFSLRRQPGLGYRACNDVPLHPVALLAMEGSQVVVGGAGLNGRQPHRRTASGALRSFVLRVEHGLLSCGGRELHSERRQSDPA